MKRLSLTGQGLRRHLKVSFALMMIIPFLVCGYLVTSYLHLGSLSLLVVITVTISLLGLSLIRGRIKSFLKIATGAKAIAEGDLTVQVKANGDDETTQLASSLNRIAEQLQRQTNELQVKTAALAQDYREIKFSHAQLEKLYQMKSDFISTVSHELRTPLTAISGYIELVSSGDAGEINEEQREFLGIATKTTKRLIASINNLLNLSALEFEMVEMKMERVRIEDIIHSARRTFESQTGGNSIRLSTDLPDGLPAIYVNSRRIEEVMENLLSNAIKFTPPGGEVKIAVGRENSCLKIRVTDTGMGIAEEELGKIFSKFYRASNGRTREVNGSGLGLAIVKSIVERHGGEVKVESQVGQGSTFSFTLPLGRRRIVKP